MSEKQDPVYQDDEMSSGPKFSLLDFSEYLLIILGILIVLFLVYLFVSGEGHPGADVSFQPVETPEYHISSAFGIVR